MLYAIKDGKRIEASTGLRATCPCCNGEVIAKCGDIYVWHWAHKHESECANWHEPETEWHKNWKECFPLKNREVLVINKETGKRHIADIKLPNGLVIEFQNSPISSETISQRESFYKKMIWVINANEFRRNIYLSDDFLCDWKHRRKSWDVSKSPKFLHFPYIEFSLQNSEDYPDWMFYNLKEWHDDFFYEQNQWLIWLKEFHTEIKIKYKPIHITNFLMKYADGHSQEYIGSNGNNESFFARDFHGMDYS